MFWQRFYIHAMENYIKSEVDVDNEGLENILRGCDGVVETTVV